MAASVYLTPQQFDAYLTGDLRAQATNAQLQAALDRASSEADGFLRTGGYALPLTEATATDDVRGRVADIARWHLAFTLQLLPGDPSKGSEHLAYQDALAWFKDVARGSITLDLPTQGTSEPGAAVIVTRPRRGWDGGW